MTQERVEEESDGQQMFFSEDEGVEEEYQASLEEENSEEVEEPSEIPQPIAEDQANAEPQPVSPEPVAASVAPAYTQEYVQNLEQQNRASQARIQAQQAMEQEQRYRQLEEDRQRQLMDAGMSPEFAASQAREIRDLQQQRDNIQNQASMAQQETQAKVMVASEYSKQYGIDINELLRFNDPISMETHAKQAKEISELRDRLGKFEKGQVPRQSRVDNGRSSRPSGSRTRQLDRLSGTENLTDKQLEEMDELLAGQ